MHDGLRTRSPASGLAVDGRSRRTRPPWRPGSERTNATAATQHAATRRPRQLIVGGVVENAASSRGTRTSTCTASTRPRWSRIRQRPASNSSSRSRSSAVVGVEVEQLERTLGLALGAQAEDERGADQVLQRRTPVEQRVADELRRDDRHGQLAAPHPLQRGEQHPPHRVAEQAPPLVEREDLQARALGRHQRHREHRDQPHDLLADALERRVVRPRAARLGRRAGRESAGRSPGAFRPAGRRTSGSAKPSWVRPAPACTASVLATCWSIVVSGRQGADHLEAGRRLRASPHRVDRGRHRGLPCRLRARREQVAQERHRGVLAQVLGRDAQRIEHPAQRAFAAQRDRLDMRRHLRQLVHAVIALRVAVDHARAEQKRLVGQLLVERRLARAERADREDRRVAVASEPSRRLKRTGWRLPLSVCPR